MEIKKIIKPPLVMLAIVLLASGSFFSIIKLLRYTYVHSTPSLIAMSLIILLISKATGNEIERTKVYNFLSALLPLIAIFHVASAFAASSADDTIFICSVVYAFVVLLCSLKLFFACVGVRVVRIGLGIVYSIVLVPLLLILLIAFLFAIAFSLASPRPSSFGSRTVVKSELSPNSIFLAEIVNADAGATGGSTLVNVIPLNSDLDIFIGTLKKDSQRIYTGRWGEFETMTLRWEGDKILCINEKQYAVK
jgi:hypothetical protein